jgi:CHAT domain-containing protein
LLYEYQATREETLKKLPGATYLHFACHGAFDVDEPLDSTLYLAGADRLTLRDLLDGDLDLSASRLAVLSACQTGITDFRKAPDEAIGFPAGFLQAGVPGVVSTLWPVSDSSTALLLARFYRYHLTDGIDPAVALNRAQQWLRKATVREMGLAEYWEGVYQSSGREDAEAFRNMRVYRANPDKQPFDHPYYWAGFVFTGSHVSQAANSRSALECIQ